MPAIRAMADELVCDVGGSLLVARRADSWEAIVAVLMSLEAEHHHYFHQVMRGCRTLSNSTPEVDGLHDLLADRDQVMFDLALDRERRRETQGYVTPAEARAFLQMSHRLSLAQGTMPPANPVAGAYFRALDQGTAALADNMPKRCRPDQTRRPSRARSSGGRRGRRCTPGSGYRRATAPGVARGIAGSLPMSPPHPGAHAVRARPRPRRLRDEERGARLSCEHDHGRMFAPGTPIHGPGRRGMRPLRSVTWASRTGRLVGSSGRDTTVPLLSNPAPLYPTTFSPHNLVTVFQVGWTVLHDDVSMYAADRLIRVLTRLRCRDREIQAGLDARRIEMARHWQAGAPWRARNALDVIAILDMPAWAALLGLIAECPVIHAGIGALRSRMRSVSASAFEFISENSHIAIAREFMQSLPAILRR
jgi:hypothetical protein